MVLIMKMAVSSDVMMCTMIKWHDHFGAICCLCLHGGVEDEGWVLPQSTDTYILKYKASQLTTVFSES